MILRKPYALFIKHFKTAHIIMALMIGFVLYRSRVLLAFFQEYISYNTVVVGKPLRETLFSNTLFYLPIILILLMTLFWIIMFRKKKPKIVYMIGFLTYLYSFVLFVMLNNFLFNMELSVVSIKSVRLYNDFLTISVALQWGMFIATVVRALGFDVRKFEFLSDLKELDITESDRELVEVSFSLDVDAQKSTLKRKLRSLKYLYYEYKIYVISSIVLALVIVLAMGLGIYRKQVKVYNQGEFLASGEYSFGITNSYVIDTDYEGKILKNKVLVVELNIRSNIKDLVLNLDKFVIKIGNMTYLPSNDYKKRLIDLGTVYDDQRLSLEYEKFLLVYELSDELLKRDITFVHKGNNEFRISITPTYLIDIETKDYSLGDLVDFTDNNFVKGTIKIMGYELNTKFSVDYQYCLNTKRCISAREYVVPTIDSNYDKALLKISAESEDTDIANLITKYGILEYKIAGSDLLFYDMKQVKPTSKNLDKIYFFEVDSRVLNAEKVSLILRLRNKEYIYKLR